MITDNIDDQIGLQDINLNENENALILPEFYLDPNAPSDDPFKLEITLMEEHRRMNQHKSASQQIVLRSDAKKMVIEALKFGDSRYSHFVALLVNHDHLFAEAKQAEDLLAQQHLPHSIPLKRDQFILDSMVTILRSVKEVLEQLSPTTLESYHPDLIASLQRTWDSLPNSFKDTIGKLIPNDADGQQENWDRCMRALRPYLPSNGVEIQTSIFNLPHSNLRLSLIARLETMIERLGNSSGLALDKYTQICTPYSELVDANQNNRRKYRQKLIAAMMETKDEESKAGIPWDYKTRFNQESDFDALANKVSLDAIDEVTGSNLALLCWEYDNLTLYKTLFSNKETETKGQVTLENKKGLSAKHYEDAKLWAEHSEVGEKALQRIETNDASGYPLRQVEKHVLNYPVGWHRLNDEKERIEARGGFFGKLQAIFHRLYHLGMRFEQRGGEAKAYLAIIQKGLASEIPAGLFLEIEKIYNEASRWGLRGSKLHGKVRKVTEMVKTNPKYHLLLTNSEITQRFSVLEEETKRQKQQITLYEDTFKTQQKQMDEQRAQYEAQLQAHQERLESQEARHQEELQAQRQQLQEQQQILAFLLQEARTRQSNGASVPAANTDEKEQSGSVTKNQLPSGQGNSIAPLTFANNPARFGYAATLPPQTDEKQVMKSEPSLL